MILLKREYELFPEGHPWRWEVTLTDNPGISCVYWQEFWYWTSPGFVDPIPSDPIRSGSDPVRSFPIRSDPVRSGPVRSGPVRSDPIRSDPGFANGPSIPLHFSELIRKYRSKSSLNLFLGFLVFFDVEEPHNIHNFANFFLWASASAISTPRSKSIKYGRHC